MSRRSTRRAKALRCVDEKAKTEDETLRLKIDQDLRRFVEEEALPGTRINAQDFWFGLEAIVQDLGPRNRGLLSVRSELQAQIDAWHRDKAGEPHNPTDYANFLAKIGYVLPEPDVVTVTTANVDDEIAHIAGPQLVVPISNARYAINAANARWGSLYDALYGTDAVPETRGLERRKSFNKARQS